MPSVASRAAARDERKYKAPVRRGPPSRLGWMGLTLGLISMDIEALVFLAALYPVVGWFSRAMIEYNPALVTTLAMLALGGPPAIAGLICAGTRRPAGWRAAPSVAGLAVCALGLAVPISYAAFAVMYLRGLI